MGVAYLAGRALAPGASYLAVFRFAGTGAFYAHAIARAIDSIWMGRAWSTTLKNLFDGLVYALLTAGTFRRALAPVRSRFHAIANLIGSMFSSL